MTRKLALSAFILLISACASDQLPVTQTDPYSGSERQIVSVWNGKPVNTLIERYGEPDMVINTTLLGRPPTEGYVYNSGRLAGNSACMNVYVVTVNDKKIMDYFCR